jgi:hypothetical protein
MKIYKTSLVIVAAGTLVIFSGCGKSEEKAASSPATIKTIIETSDGEEEAVVRVTDAGVEIESGGTTASYRAGKDLALPDDFPADIFIYPNAAVETDVSTEDGRMVSLRTADSVDKVTSVYRSRMPGLGWTEDAAATMGGQSLLSYQKEGRAAAIIIGSDGENTQIAVSVSSGKADE